METKAEYKDGTLTITREDFQLRQMVGTAHLTVGQARNSMNFR